MTIKPGPALHVLDAAITTKKARQKENKGILACTRLNPLNNPSFRGPTPCKNVNFLQSIHSQPIKKSSTLPSQKTYTHPVNSPRYSRHLKTVFLQIFIIEADIKIPLF
jgi:hypothetical protein